MCTRRQNELQELMKSENIETVNTGLERLNDALVEYENSHQSVQELLVEEEVETDNNWYRTKMQTFETFLKEVDAWKAA